MRIPETQGRLLGALAGAWAAVVAVAAPAQAQVELMSRSVATGTMTAGVVPINQSVSADGRFVAFASAGRVAPGAGDTNGAADVFLYDRMAGTATLVSHKLGDASASGNAGSDTPAVSADGQYVTFRSSATDLVSGLGFCCGNSQVFLWEGATGSISLVSHKQGQPTTPGNGTSHWGYRPSISQDGEYVVFQSTSNDLTGASDGNGTYDVFLFERRTGDVALVSHAFGLPATAAGGLSSSPVVSLDGSRVAFASNAPDLVSGSDTNGLEDVFLYDRASGSVSLASHKAGSPGTAGSDASFLPLISGNGRYVAFLSRSTDLITLGLDLNGVEDAFLWDSLGDTMKLASHIPGLFTTAGNGWCMELDLSADGRFVAFTSLASNLALTDFNGTTDVFVYDDILPLTVAVASHTALLATSTANGSSFGPSLSGDGSRLAFFSQATDLVSGVADANGDYDVFAYETATTVLTLLSDDFALPPAAGNGPSSGAIVSADASIVVFSSLASDLTAVADTNLDRDLFAAVPAGAVELLSRADPLFAPATPNAPSFAEPLSTSADGRYTVFTSTSATLVSGLDLNGQLDVFLYDRVTQTVTLVSHSLLLATTAGNGASLAPRISADGEYVVFRSFATDLTFEPDANGTAAADVFLYQRAGGFVTLVSSAALAGTTANGDSDNAVIDATGRFVAFQSLATNLRPGVGDGNGMADVYLYDRVAASSQLVSHIPGAAIAGDLASAEPSISASGRFVTFRSTATNLIAAGADLNGTFDVFLYDALLDTTALISHRPALPGTTGNSESADAMISADGSFAAFRSRSTNLLVVTDTNSGYDAFLYERATGNLTLMSHAVGLPTTAANGTITRPPSINGNGGWVAFTSGATNMTTAFDFNSGNDVFTYERASDAVKLISQRLADSNRAGDFASFSAVIDSSGEHVAFESNATDLTADTDSNGVTDTFLYRIPGATMTLVSRAHGVLPRTGDSYSTEPALSGDGRYVAFESIATNLIVNDVNGTSDAFLFGRVCLPGAPDGLFTFPTTPNRIDLFWSGPASTYEVYRSRSAGGPFELIGTTTGTGFVDAPVEGGVTYYYAVSNTCGATAIVSASTTGTCALPPDFGGASAAWQEAGVACGVKVFWDPAASACGGDVVYSVYRDTTPSLVPSAATRIAAGTGGTSYFDSAGLEPGTTYDYVVRALDLSNASEDANLVVRAVTPEGCVASEPAMAPFFNVRATSGENRLMWVDPVAGFDTLRVLFRTDMFPTGPGDASATPLGDFPGTPGAVHVIDHTGLIDTTTYFYAAFTQDALGGFSAPRFSFGRPATLAGDPKWSYTTGAAALSIAGVLPGRGYFGVSNDRAVNAMAPGAGGGHWPAGWTPLGLNGPAQGRPTVVALPVTTVNGASRVALVASQDGRVYAIDADTGAPLWASAVLAPMLSASPAAMFRDFGGPYDLVFVGTRDALGANRLVALNLADGTQAWSFDNLAGPDAIGIVSSQAYVDYPNRRVYFTSRENPVGSNHTVWCLEFTDTSATKLWSAPARDIDAAPVLRGTVVYVGNTTGEVFAFDNDSDTPLWSVPYTTGDGAVKGRVWAEAGSTRLYFSTNGKVHAIRDNGTFAGTFWAGPISIASPSAPLLVNGRLYVGGAASRLWSIEATNPTPPAPGSVVFGAPAVPKTVGGPTYDASSGLLLAGTDQGVIYSATPF